MSTIPRRSARRRAAAALVGVACAGFVMSASGSGVGARPVVEIPSQASPADDAATTVHQVGGGHGSNATVSGDGRFLVFQGLPGNGAEVPEGDTRTSTVYLTDRETATTTELTPVTGGVRPGSSVNPVIAGDGCSVVVATEMALDVFRDDDTGSRWDIYVRRLEHCGGGGTWELVSSTADRTGLARDDVSIVDPPSISRSGTIIAYTHPADQLIDGEGITTVSVVDLGQPIVSPSRARVVAGMPIASPETSFVHTGIDQPALSGDGRFVAYRSDAVSQDAVAGWGAGRDAGGPATKQVYVWDRDESDPFDAVKLVSERTDGLPTVSGAAEPALSRDGRVVVFTSADVGLVPAVFPPCAPDCPTQVFRLDRDTDRNDWYDEAGRTAMTMVSSVVDTDPVVAGVAPSAQPSVTADGQLVAFVTKAQNLQLVKAGAGGEASDGDLLVADAGRGTLRRVTLLADGVQPALGAHSRPQLSDTGRTTVFDTLAAPQLLPGAAPGRQVLAVTAAPSLALADADLGSTLVGFTSDEWYVAVINDGPTSFTPSSVKVSDPRFTINQETSTCSLGVPVPPGADCTVRLAFTPDALGPVTAQLTVSESGFEAISVTATVRGAGGEPTLRANPAGADLGDGIVGMSAPEVLFDVENIALVPAAVAAVRIDGDAAADFSITSNSCANKSLNPRGTCSIGVTFSPTASGHRTAVVTVETTTGQYTTVVVAGDGTYWGEVDVEPTEVDAGDQYLLGVSGFPPSAPLAIFFGDEPADFVSAVTTERGDLLTWVPVDADERGGPRTVVVQALDGTAASDTIDVVSLDESPVGLPGFGLGG